ncbi:MAG TPA: hypothetical protein PKK79_09150 [Syntrophorhabdaceae bacterium]|nr:hypothetical protein [Syntrophorhabdaceae bacterium]
MIRRYVAMDHDGSMNETTNARMEIAGVTRTLRIPFEASRLLISTDVISGVLVRYHQ